MLFAGILSCCALVHALPTLRPGLIPETFPADEFGVRRIPLSSAYMGSVHRQAKLGPNAKLLWNNSVDAVGKLSSISLNADQDFLVVGTTYTPLNQVSSIQLSTGKILSKAAPGNQFTYTTALSRNGTRTAVYGCSLNTEIPCTLAVWDNNDVSKKPTWTKNIPGIVLWGARGMRMSADGLVVAAAELNQSGISGGSVSWMKGTDGTRLGQYDMDLTMGEIWLNSKYIATRDFVNNGSPYLEGYLRFIPLSTSDKNCTVRADYQGLDVSSGLKTVIEPYVDGTNVYAHWAEGAGSCADIGKWAIPAEQEFVAIATSDYATVVATFEMSSRIFTFYNFVGLKPVQKPTSFTLQLPEQIFEAVNVHMTFSVDGTSLALDVASLGTYYLDLTESPPQPKLVYSNDNPCGVLALSIDVATTTKTTYILASYNQLLSVQPGMLECMLGGNGLAAFALS